MFLLSSRFRAIMEQNQSTFLNSPTYFGGFLCKSMLDDHDHIFSSPTSILDTKQFCKKPIFGYNINNPYDQSKGIGLALEDQDFDKFSNPKSKNMVLFGAKLKKVRIPVISSHVEITHDEHSISIPSFSTTTTTSDLINLKSPHIGLALEDQDFDKFSNPKSKNMVLFGEKLKKVRIPVISSHAEITHDDEQSISIPSFSTITTTSDLINLKSPHIGLALEDQDFDKFSNPKSKNMALFGANLKKVQIPVISSHVEITHDEQSIPSFSTTTKSEFINLKSPCLRELGLSLSEMKLLEEYTCVMKHGNGPKITHIFDDMIVESCGGGFGNLCDLKNEDDFKTKGNMVTSLPVVFLEFCYNCKVKLDDDKDVYIYRGEKSFCSPECRFEEMMIDEDD